MVSTEYLIYGFKRLFRKPILEVIHFGLYNSRLIPIHVSNKLMLNVKGSLGISDYEFATDIMGLNLSDNSDIYESVYQYTKLNDTNCFFFNPDNLVLKENYLSNYAGQAEETIEYANKYLNHEFNFLGRQINFDAKVNYHYGYEQISTLNKYFTDVNYFIPGWDIKVTWELNRQQYLPILGKAYFITNDEKYAKEVCDQIDQWIEQNPYLLGVNWIEGIEAAIRMYSWIFAYHFIRNSKSFTPDINLKILKNIYLHGKFIRTFLSDKWIINGNHLLAELSGLLLIGVTFPEFKESKEWVSFALQKLEYELDTQVFDDGAIWEHSTGYQKFVTEMVLYPVILLNKDGNKVPESILLKLEKMLDFLDSIAMSTGKIPLIGDEDQGFMLKLNFSEYDDIRDILSCGNILLNKKYPCFRSELAFWLFNGLVLTQSEMFVKKQNFKLFKESGYCLFKSPDDYLLLVTNAQNKKYLHGAHRHLDMLNFVYECYGEYFIVDSGTYAYNGDKQNRFLFRSLYMHNTLTVDKNNPCSLGPFEIQPCPYAKIMKYGKIHEAPFVWCSHDGYTPILHNRAVVQVSDGYLIYDLVDTQKSHHYEVYIHLHPSVKIGVIDEFTIVLSKRQPIYISSSKKIKIVNSQFSPRYGEIIDSKTLKVEASCCDFTSIIKISRINPGITPYDHGIIESIFEYNTRYNTNNVG